MFKNRSVATVIILSIVTCGIYMLYWFWVAINELYNAGHKSIADLSPVIQFILMFFYVGGIFFAINAEDNLNEARTAKGLPTTDNKVLYIILALVIPIVLVALVQTEMNKLADQA